METYGNPPEEFENFRRRAAISEPIRLDYADRKAAVAKTYLDSLARQARAADRLSFVSPAGLFRAVAATICRTDLAAHARRMDGARQYRETFIRWLRGKNIFSSLRWVTPADPASFKTQDQLTEARTGGEFKTYAALDAWAREQPDARARWLKLSRVKVPGDGPDDYPYLDLADMPRFESAAPSLWSGLESTVLELGLMLVEAVILFALAYVAFLRYDVR